jgi:deazaflavin-dependent oxidoreductase (nitroreductase family)
MPLDDRLAAEAYCYLTTTGRVTGRPHTIEIWFARPDTGGRTIYLLAGGRDRSDWVRNLQRQPAVTVRIADRTFEAGARILDGDGDEPREARRLLYEKYQPGYSGDLAEWRETALPVALDRAGVG